MISKSTLALIAAVASMGIASPAFAQARTAYGSVLPLTYDAQGGRHYFTYGYSQTTAPDYNQTFVHQSSHEQIAGRQSGLHAFAMITHDAQSGYNPATTGYDGSIETQR
jgi:hypothetical protein